MNDAEDIPERKRLDEATKQSAVGSSKGGHVRATRLDSSTRSDIARKAAQMRWQKRKDELVSLTRSDLPEAKYKGVLRLMDSEIPCYVLSDGRRVIGRTSATEMLTGIKGGGDFESYISVAPLRPFIDVKTVTEKMVSFYLPEVEALDRQVRGLPANELLEVCRGFVAALDASTRPDSTVRLTRRQMEIAIRASVFLAACAKVGLEALIDEATGYQFDRAEDALQVKLKAYLEQEMRKWEKTFPDELWIEFGRLTGWSKSVTQRPKYWGKLVMELVYEYLDEDVADWLRVNAPTPRHGQNYHQWLTGQYGLQKLVQHIWTVIGVAQTCTTMSELRERMAAIHGKQPIQLRLFLPAPNAQSF